MVNRKVELQRNKGGKIERVNGAGLEKREVGGSVLKVGRVDVPIGVAGIKTKVRRVNETVGGAVRLGREEMKVLTERKEGTVGDGRKEQDRKEERKTLGKQVLSIQQHNVIIKEKNAGIHEPVKLQQLVDVFHFTPMYSSCVEDRKWASSSMVASVIAGDSAVTLQQRVEDAGFPNLVVTPLGSDCVFLYCIGGEDVWKVYKGAFEFFNVILSNIQKWSASEVRYERGAWVRVYGVPVHAWNEVFFRLCVSGAGRYIHADEC